MMLDECKESFRNRHVNRGLSMNDAHPQQEATTERTRKEGPVEAPNQLSKCLKPLHTTLHLQIRLSQHRRIRPIIASPFTLDI